VSKVSYTSRILKNKKRNTIPAYHSLTDQTRPTQPTTQPQTIISVLQYSMEKANVDRICTHMNDDHGLSVYAMAMRSLYASGKAGTTSSQSLSKISLKNAKLSDISLKDYTLSYVYCNGDVCSMERVTVPFQQPFMTSPSDARSVVSSSETSSRRLLYCVPPIIYDHVVANLVGERRY
jgi:hypothetical protein